MRRSAILTLVCVGLGLSACSMATTPMQDAAATTDTGSSVYY
jgi:hypothetical protein